jgi:hypothetical protein
MVAKSSKKRFQTNEAREPASSLLAREGIAVHYITDVGQVSGAIVGLVVADTIVGFDIECAALGENEEGTQDRRTIVRGCQHAQSLRKW